MRNKANQQIAHTDASALEHEVWHLWLDWEQQSEEGEDDDGVFVDYVEERSGGDDLDGAAASSRQTRKTARRGRGNAIKIGSVRFIIDAGCGSNLIALQYLQDAGLAGQIMPMVVPLTLNTVGGLSQALGTVRIACGKLGDNLEFVVMPETPNVISVGELRARRHT